RRASAASASPERKWAKFRSSKPSRSVVSASIVFILGDIAAAFGVGGFQQGFEVGQPPVAKLVLEPREALGGFEALCVLFPGFEVGIQAVINDGRPKMAMV